jgi:hypothetical protein
VMLDRTGEEELQDVPLWVANKAAWPQGVRPVGVDELHCLGIDRRGNIYWDGKPVEVRHFVLTRSQKIWAILVALAAIGGGIGSCTQGALLYNEWACREDLPALMCQGQAEESAQQPAGG